MKKIIIALMFLAGVARAAGPALPVGTLVIKSNTTALCTLGDTCLWATGDVLKWQKASGAQFVLTTPVTIVTNTVPGLVPVLAATLGAVPVDNGNNTIAFRKLTPDDLGPAFAITSFSASGGGWSSSKEIGDTIAGPVGFTVAYSTPASSASLADGINTTVTLISPFTSATESHSYVKTVPNQVVTWTLTAIAATTKTASVSTTWLGRVYYGIQTPGTINSAFVTSLPSSGLQSGFAATYAIGAGLNTKKAYVFFDDAFGTPTVFKDAGTGFAVPMTCTASAVSVTNAFSVARSFTECVSDNFLNASFNLQVQ